jgi:hypothetical protein
MFRFAEDDDADHGDEVERAPRHIPWLGPPEEELGGVVPLALVVGRSERGAVALPQVSVYSTGIRVDVVALARGLTNAQSNRLFHEQHLFEPGEEPPEGFLRIGLELPGGERVSNLGGRSQHRRLFRGDEEPEGPVFVEHGGGGGSSGGGRVSMRPSFWLWPLPDPGAIRVFCEWPLVEIPLSTAELEGDALAAAVERVVQLWPAPSA